MFSITLKNSSQPVELEESSKVLGEDVIISAQIDDIFVSIKDQGTFGPGAIIAIPYEVRVPSLKEGEEKELEFELIKEEVRDVVVNLKYLDIEEDRNIHLKQEEPYISVLSARRYKDEDRRRLELILKYGAVLGASASRSDLPVRRTQTGQGGEAESSNPSKGTAYSSAQEINNVYVSVQDEFESIIGVPYEIRIPTMKDQQQQALDFELRRNVDNIIVSLRYLDNTIFSLE